MLVLALDTSSAAVSVVVADVSADAVTVLTRTRTVDARGHAEHLSPNIAAALEQAASTPADLAAVVVGTGPGPFTGLRVGLVTAAALSEALGIPAYGTCSLDGFAVSPGHVVVAADARRKEVFWARYRDGERVEGPGVDHPAALDLDGVDALVGAGARLYADAFGREPSGDDYPDPAVLLDRLKARVVAGEPSDPLTPLYLRRPDAVPPKSMSR